MTNSRFESFPIPDSHITHSALTLFTTAELEAYLDEALPVEQMTAIERALRGSPDLVKQLSQINGRRDAGVHSLGEIWRASASVVPRANSSAAIFWACSRTNNPTTSAFTSTQSAADSVQPISPTSKASKPKPPTLLPAAAASIFNRARGFCVSAKNFVAAFCGAQFRLRCTNGLYGASFLIQSRFRAIIVRIKLRNPFQPCSKKMKPIERQARFSCQGKQTGRTGHNQCVLVPE